MYMSIYKHICSGLDSHTTSQNMCVHPVCLSLSLSLYLCVFAHVSVCGYVATSDQLLRGGNYVVIITPYIAQFLV